MVSFIFDFVGNLVNTLLQVLSLLEFAFAFSETLNKIIDLLVLQLNFVGIEQYDVWLGVCFH